MKSTAFSFFLFLASLADVTCFTTAPLTNTAHRSSLVIAQAAKKGFGSTSETPKKKKTAAPKSPATTNANPAPSSSSSATQTQAPQAAPSAATPTDNAGQRALAEMRRQRAEQKDAELRKVRAMLEADKQLEETPAAIPERVAQRMGQRMLPFVGLPLLGGMGCFVAFWYLATYKNMEFQPVLVAGSTILILVFSLLVSNRMAQLGESSNQCGNCI